ncbi:DEAD/DEAH box helicase [Kocuria nitroreducens]|uniref:DEAD/DEAH box helicase n=1 Tax=Kocuria nitroreducens TaxID=3058914 RepID=UPI0036DB24F8
MSVISVDLGALTAVSKRLDLREPNREAVESIAFELVRHYDIEKRPAPFEGVVDSATGMGKTYIFAGALEYLALVEGVRNFALIAPSRTILDKTVAQLTPGNPKSITHGMNAPLVVITADNFNTPSMATAMEDDSQVKLYVFTIQSLLKPSTKAGRRTHDFQEGLGSGLYQRMQEADDLVVFADEHHAYYGKQFSAAVRELNPWALIGLTATPHKSTPADQIIFRYPLAAAIAGKYVKTPVIVGRRDDKHDPVTKLLDGTTLLERKRELADEWAAAQGVSRVNPVMLVVARDITEAEHWASIVRSSDFKGGAYRDAVLVVHSKAVTAAKEETELRRLQDIEHPDSPIRVVISVQMLKEGWDVKNVYALLSTQPSLSDVLTEQVLGRGLRLPFGEYTGIEMLDTLEVLAHDKYEDLLRRKNVFSEQFIDHKIRAHLRTDSRGNTVVVREVEVVENPVLPEPAPPVAEPGNDSSGPGRSAETNPDTAPTTVNAGSAVEIRTGAPSLATIDARSESALEQRFRLNTEIAPRRPVQIPILRPMAVKSTFSLTDITDHEQFRRLGQKIRTSPDDTLRRTVISAEVYTDPFVGLKSTRLRTAEAVDRIEASGLVFTMPQLRAILTDAVLGLGIIVARRDDAGVERRAIQPILDAFLDGLNGGADTILSAYLQRATALLLDAVNKEYRRFASAPQFEEIVSLTTIDKIRHNTRPVTGDKHGHFDRGQAYEGWQRSVYSINWFDSAPERDLALLLDEATQVKDWCRLLRNDLPILWAASGQRYNADFIATTREGFSWVLEVKADNQVTNDEVMAKREAAKRWVNKVNASNKTSDTWKYLLVTETDIRTARGSWPALQRLGQ